MKVILKSGDIFLTRGKGFISKAIRFFTQAIGEKRTKVNHVGVTVQEGDLKTCIVVEALKRVVEHPLWSQYGPPKEDSVAVFRPINMTVNEIETVVNEALEQVNKKYGYHVIFAHMLDWFLLGAYVFRRTVKDGRYPICSWLVAHSFSKADKYFDVEPGAATPDDIWDFVIENPDKYKQIYPLKPIWDVNE